MLDLSQDTTNALIAVAAVLLYGFAWWMLRELPLLAKITARLLLALAMIAPLVLMLTLGSEAPVRSAAQKREKAPEVAARRIDDAEGMRPRMQSAPREPAIGGTGAAPPASKNGGGDTSPPKASEAGPAVGAAPPPPVPVAPAPSAPAPSAPAPAAAPPPPTPAEVPKPAEVTAPTTRGLARPQPGAPTEETKQPDQSAEFDTVPVFFGTDRQRQPNDKRLSYGADRGRKLELGRALVTVPKAHEVPQVERPWALRIPYFNVTLYEEAEDPRRHFTMREIKSLTREELIALVRERLAASSRFKDHALVFVHGYNTAFDNAIYRTAQIAYDLKFDGAPFLYSWPSGGAVGSYTYDRESAGQAEPYLKEFLQLVANETGAKQVSVIAHSMGNQVVLRVLQDLMRATPPGVTLNQLVLAAPDVDRDAFENIATALKGIAKGITLYAASNDRALGVSRRFHGGVPRAGDVPDNGPLLVPGIDTIDVTSQSTDSFGLNHSGYAENNTLVNDIALLIQTGERPPENRIPILERIKTDKGDYWRYPARN